MRHCPSIVSLASLLWLVGCEPAPDETEVPVDETEETGQAIRRPPTEGGAPCSPQTHILADASRVYFYATTSCNLPLPYTMQMTYAQGNPGRVWKSKTCYNGPGQRDCGLNGIVTSVPNPAGRQQFCMAHVLWVPTAGGGSEKRDSLINCASL